MKGPADQIDQLLDHPDVDVWPALPPGGQLIDLPFYTGTESAPVFSFSSAALGPTETPWSMATLPIPYAKLRVVGLVLEATYTGVVDANPVGPRVQPCLLSLDKAAPEGGTSLLYGSQMYVLPWRSQARSNDTGQPTFGVAGFRRGVILGVRGQYIIQPSRTFQASGTIFWNLQQLPASGPGIISSITVTLAARCNVLFDLDAAMADVQTSISVGTHPDALRDKLLAIYEGQQEVLADQKREAASWKR